MVDNKSMQTGKRQMGMERWKYLDMANLSFAGGNYGACKGYLEAFLETISENSEEGKTLQLGFERIETDRQSKVSELQKDSENWGYLEQLDGNDVRREIEINSLYEQKTLCWTTSINFNLFEA